MRSSHPRPTYVEVPLDVAGAEEEVELLPPAEDFPRPSGGRDEIARAPQLLGQAGRPLVLGGGGGGGARGPRGPAPARRAAPVIMAGHGRGAIPDDDPISLGDGWGRLTY